MSIAPASEAEVADAVRLAAANGTRLEIISAGTKRDFGRTMETDAVLDMRALSGILKYEREELVLTVLAGTPLAEIEAVLAEKKQMLGFEPADWGPLFGAREEEATLAGVVATNACGSRRLKAGAVRDAVIGCRFVNGKGEAIKAGGRVIKNVTGFDVPKLICGAFGTLGVLTELTLRVVPKPAQIAALMVHCSARDGLHILREAAKLALDPTGLAYIPKTGGLEDNDGTAVIRVEGTAESVKQKLAELKHRIANAGSAVDAEIAQGDIAGSIFRDVSNGALFHQTNGDIWRLCVPVSNAYDALAALDGKGENLWCADWAGGLLWLGLPATVENAARLREITARFGGHATLMRGSAEARKNLAVFEPEVPMRAELTRAVKAAFDPKRVLNPGRMYKDV